MAATGRVDDLAVESGRSSTNPDDGFGNEFKARNGEVLRCWTLANATCSIIVRSMTRAEPASEVPGLPKRDAA